MKTPFCLFLVLLCSSGWAENLTYNQAKQSILNNSYSVQANASLNDADQLNAEAVKYLGLPRIDLNGQAYSFETKTKVPLTTLKNNLTDGLTQRINNPVVDDVIHQAVNDFIPNSADVTAKDHDTRASLSMIAPLYTGGLITSTKNIAQLQANRSKVGLSQQIDTQKFEIIQVYFNAQLQKTLWEVAQFNLDTFQNHVNNAYKLEQQGFISKGQRMQFEVARNDALLALNTATTQKQNSLFELQKLLQTNADLNLTTPLIIPHTSMPILKIEQSKLLQKMQLDTQLAQQNIKIQEAEIKPKLYGFGEVDQHKNWVVGIAAQYNLLSGINHHKQIQAAQAQAQATQYIQERTAQELETLAFKSSHQLQEAQQTDVLLKQNLQAAQENLRIQTLSYREGMGTVAQIIDAQNALNRIKAESATNTYRYIMALATLLQINGDIDQFQI